MFEDDGSFIQGHQQKSNNYVKFYRHFVKKFNDYRDYILIICPGQSKTEVRQPVQESHKREYPVEWQQYQSGVENQINGTAVELMGFDEGMINELKIINIYTIEQLADASDLGLQKLMGGYELRTRAKAFLAKNTVEVVELRSKMAELQAELEKQKDLQATVLALQEQLNQFKAEEEAKKQPQPQAQKTLSIKRG